MIIKINLNSNMSEIYILNSQETTSKRKNCKYQLIKL